MSENKFFIVDDVYPPFIGLNRTGDKLLSLEVENPLGKDIKSMGFTIYKYLDSGGNGAVYLTDVDSAGHDSFRDVIKIQPITSPERETAFKREIEFQDRAARADLAPAIKTSGFINFSDGLIGYVEMEKIEIKDFIHLYQTENPIKKAFACEYIKKLSGIGLINTKDPKNHFYIDNSRLKMIDFGEVEDISSLTPVKKREKMNEMAAAMGIDCEREFRGGKKKRKTRKKNSKTKKIKTKKIKNKNEKNKNKKSK